MKTLYNSETRRPVGDPLEPVFPKPHKKNNSAWLAIQNNLVKHCSPFFSLNNNTTSLL